MLPPMDATSSVGPLIPAALPGLLPPLSRAPPAPSDLAADAAEFRKPAFRDVLGARVALIAPAERSRFLSLLEEDPAIETFAQEGNDRFDAEVGTRMAREKLVRIAWRPLLCSALVRICRAVIRADGVVHPAEHRAVAEIRSALGVTAA